MPETLNLEGRSKVKTLNLHDLGTFLRDLPSFRFSVSGVPEIVLPYGFRTRRRCGNLSSYTFSLFGPPNDPKTIRRNKFDATDSRCLSFL